MIISQDHIDEIFAHTKRVHPEECCGLIIGKGDEVTDLMASRNVSESDRTKTFEIDPATRFKLIREQGHDAMIGFYHSHPNGIPYPSKTDKTMVYEPEMIWIIATQDEIKAFKFDEIKQDFAELPIQVKL
ncbi:M67 family metallopeptidase [Terasakiella sp. A23]|uniref:M67 family metallopeptidase n=1 Tax=Terasakiella sp. FCG-A23 TaxID=3080561 RepID=UPI002953EA95|nr:M67 family metallopeptidase [Terasakiella sp. A23]MDV7339378.1 M67 family metallopeptidase [Terasakiella sp. A23]